jgi:hypothetical protein
MLLLKDKFLYLFVIKSINEKYQFCSKFIVVVIYNIFFYIFRIKTKINIIYLLYIIDG